MGKTPKKAAPEGDERNRYVRRLKTASASSKHEDDVTASLIAARSNQPEYENTNRGKLTSSVQKNLKTASASKTFKSKLRSPVVKSSLSRMPKSTTNKVLSSEREASKPVTANKVFKQKTLAMEPKAEDLETEMESQATENVEEEYVSEETILIIKSKKMDVIDSSSIVDEDKNNGETGSMNNDKQKDTKEPAGKNADSGPDGEIVDDLHAEPKLLSEDVIIQISDNDEAKDESEEHEARLNLTIDDSPLKVDLKEELNGSHEPEAIENVLHPIVELQDENCHVAEEKDDQGEDLADTESCSVDVVESTTSEVSEASEPAQLEPENITTKGVQIQPLKDDVSFVSFDASIMLKDVQVRLNDCLKDNSQLFEITNEERSISEPACKDSSFGRTLRNISGRHSINRMRHVTLRSRMSPNSSLYVNMSTVSSPDEEARDHKILHYRTGLSSTLTCNGTPTERKRKRDPETCSEVKKVKTETESSLINTSIGILQGLRRPIQVSTPNVGGYKFKPEKLDISGIIANEDKIVGQEQSGAAKKWCSIM